MADGAMNEPTANSACQLQYRSRARSHGVMFLSLFVISVRGRGEPFVTEWQVSHDAGARGLLAGEARRDADVAAYRDAVAALLQELVAPSSLLTVETAERVLNRRLREPVFDCVLSAVPMG